VDAVVDAVSSPPVDPDETRRYFATATSNLLAAEERAGVRHHVLLSIVGIDRMDGGTAHYAGKREQERLVEAGRVPWTIVPATQFYDFAAMAASWTERDGVAIIAPLLVQPIAPDDIAAVLAEVATGAPQGRHVDVAGPEPQDLVDMARRTHAVLGRDVRLIPSWSGPLGLEMAGNVLLPAENARIAATTFDQWLAAGAK
jgi:uncharacterized protein YbjT (DUF2867 family)